jgi:hypothetical protein
MPRTLRFGALSTLPLLGCLLVSGCRQVDNPGKLAPGSPDVEATRSVELQRHQLYDVPVPRDMTLITRANQSYSYVAPGVRVARLRYRGDVSVEESIDFLRRTMPLSAYGWTSSGERTEGETSILDFVKGGDRCEARAFREDGATTLLIHVNCDFR